MGMEILQTDHNFPRTLARTGKAKNPKNDQLADGSKHGSRIDDFTAKACVGFDAGCHQAAVGNYG
jgi:hypothetical protein